MVMRSMPVSAGLASCDGSAAAVPTEAADAAGSQDTQDSAAAAAATSGVFE